MSIEGDLERLDWRIEDLRGRIETAYREGRGIKARGRLWAELDSAIAERTYLLCEWEGTEIPFNLWCKVTSDRLYAAFAELAQKWVDAMAPYFEEWDRRTQGLRDAAGLTSYRLQALVNVGETSRKPGPRQIFRTAAVGVGPIGALEFHHALPATRRPVLRGFQRQKGKG